MSVIDRAKAHFEEISKPILVEVPEWGEAQDKPLMVYFSPLTMGEKRKLFKKAKDDDIGFLVDVIIMKSRDSDGTPMFKPEDRAALMSKCDPEVIERLARHIPGTDFQADEDESLKN